MLHALVAAITIAQAAPTALPARPGPTARPARPAHGTYQPNVYINAADYLPGPTPTPNPHAKKHAPKNTMKSAAPKQDVFETHTTGN
jgi:hypothetical protein